MSNEIEQPSSEERGADCACWDSNPCLLVGSCTGFEDNDKGVCIICGHVEECHDNS